MPASRSCAGGPRDGIAQGCEDGCRQVLGSGRGGGAAGRLCSSQALRHVRRLIGTTPARSTPVLPYRSAL
eukprot:363219-Chlamydomonas_euryale.AAC.5